MRFAATATPVDFGKLAPDITRAAAQGDALAKRVMDAAVAEVSKSLILTGWTEGLPICLAGGIGPHYASYLPDEMKRDLVEPEGTPLDGAIALALEFRDEIVGNRS